MILLSSKCGARFAVPAQTVAEAARLIQGVLNSDHTVSVNGEQIAIGKFHGMKLVQVWEFAPAGELAFVSPVKWQDGLAFALAGRLPVHVRCLLDEFANIGQIPNFDKLVATIRSREISASIILQSQSQLKTIYKDAADTIVGNCDTTLFLGGKEKSTLKEISELLGKETIDSFNQSENRGSQVSHGLNYQKLGKELMTQDEIAVMDGGKCILQLRGVRPFFSDKFDITRHPRYKYLADADKKNTFDIERYMKRRPAIVKPDEPFDLYELKATDLQPNNSTERKEM